jgi:hypothetical protein
LSESSPREILKTASYRTSIALYRIQAAFSRQSFLLGLKTNRVSFFAKSE